MAVTAHVREMLSGALDLAEAAETAEGIEVERLLEGAAVLARHAAAECDDERFRHRHPRGYRP